jgi:peptidylamidoglycolate lyase
LRSFVSKVFKFKEDTDSPILTLGKAFEPAQSNQDEERFCQPTDVAVASNGDIYVADGSVNFDSNLLQSHEDISLQVLQ